jgi:hypothetical protein
MTCSVVPQTHLIYKTEILVPGLTYRVYTRADGSEKLFRFAKNYRFFMEKYQPYISPVADTFCYCLMPNHFSKTSAR